MLTERERESKNKFLKLNSFNTGDLRVLMTKIEPKTIDLIFTSPPYNVAKNYDKYDDNKSYTDYLNFLNAAWIKCKRVLKDDGRLIINVPSVTYNGYYQPLYVDVVNQCRKLGFIMRSDIVWYKQAMSKRTAWGSWMSPSSPYVIQPYEFILVFQKTLKMYKHIGNKKNIDITREEFIKFSDGFWNIKAETTLSKVHPAPFPFDLAYRILKFYTYKNDTVLDPFGGTGTTALACSKTGRNFIYIDISKKYTKYAKNRVKKGIVLGSQILNGGKNV